MDDPPELDYGDDGRSSSLSDLEDVAVDDRPQLATPTSGNIESENDSEAETERLENSPVKVRKHRDVVVSSNAQRTLERSPSKGLERSTPDLNASLDNGEDQHGSLLKDGFPHVTNKSSSPSMAGQKRKRQEGDGSTEGQKENIGEEEPLKKRTGSIRHILEASDAAGDVTIEDNSSPVRTFTHTTSEDQEDQPEGSSDAEPEPVLGLDARRDSPNLDESREASPADSTVSSDQSTMSRRKTARKRKKAEDKGMELDAATPGNNAQDPADMNDGDEVDTTVKNEEEMLKKTKAMDSLSIIEQEFATFRDKLYDERLAQLSNELALLTGPEPTHADYLAQLKCIDARRDEKIRLEKTIFDYKIQALQVKHTATRHQIHSQYFQTVRDIRERILEQAGERWYQIQRDRRDSEVSVPDYVQKFPTSRSQQIMQQSAYNREVSVLSGVAKHVGFPAAPEMEGARPSEVDSDMQAMGL